MSILCLIGIHDWRFYSEYDAEGARGKTRGWMLKCQRCKDVRRGDDFSARQNHICPFDKPIYEGQDAAS